MSLPNHGAVTFLGKTVWYRLAAMNATDHDLSDFELACAEIARLQEEFKALREERDTLLNTGQDDGDVIEGLHRRVFDLEQTLGETVVDGEELDKCRSRLALADALAQSVAEYALKKHMGEDPFKACQTMIEAHDAYRSKP